MSGMGGALPTELRPPGGERVGREGVVRRIGTLGADESAANGSMDVRLVGMPTGPPVGERIEGRAAPPMGGRLRDGRGLVVLNGGDSVGNAEPLPAAAISDPLTSSSEEVKGDVFLIARLPSLGPLPLRKRGGAPGEVGSFPGETGPCGNLMGGRERGSNCPGRMAALVGGLACPRARRA